ncbi:MAG: hypothetical protein AMXMBFR64_17850 [Myxococcales bacterium]
MLAVRAPFVAAARAGRSGDRDMASDFVELLAALDGIAQDPRHHPEGDALYHSLQVFGHARAETGDLELVTAALLHDAGKAISSREHDVLGAKRIAARRLPGQRGRLRDRRQDLPSNGEIREALLELVELTEGASRGRRLFSMRVTAWQTMGEQLPFRPRLIGSVATGHVRSGSDIDLHVFTKSEQALEAALWHLGWTFEASRVCVRKGGIIREFTHVHVDRGFPVELSVYLPGELRVRGRSSTDGRPIQRLSRAGVERLLERDHPAEWASWQRGATRDLADSFDVLDTALEDLLDGDEPGPSDVECEPMTGPWGPWDRRFTR